MFGKIGSGFVFALITIDQQGGTIFPSFPEHLLVGFDSVGTYGNNTVTTGVSLAATDEVILPTVDLRDCEQLARPATAGYQDQSNICCVMV